ncbi:SMI1/KNR4 family protein [Pseudomonas muyukensis]|jgi:hypothetical protein|uniref:SMI1/KNR4 family protein n=1 Tax=Pseudomonas muyukensis TaxID=2842357 RepID=A0ABX8M614_9PSED|nr:SMI1/KNR4 family protein [Pseudomonas muyukensis]QXH34167.1 SMI1/KNR4 family protein [Pseudomonas muyukensis]
MSKDLLQDMLVGTSVRQEDCLGYSDEDLAAISRLYNINVEGQLKGFLSVLGLSDGGLFKSDAIAIYNAGWGVRQHVLFQTEFCDKMQDAGLHKFLGKPFVICYLPSGEYYYLRTKEGDAVYSFDGCGQSVAETGYDLKAFLKISVAPRGSGVSKKSGLLEI